MQDKNILGSEAIYEDLKVLIESTLLRGESNSALLLGPRGVGKTRMINLLLDKLRETKDRALIGEGLVVSLNGLVQIEDKSALKAITKQLQLEEFVGEKTFGSFAQHLEFLLGSLRSGRRNESKPIVFVLEEFDAFASCGRAGQTLLYNLFDIVQSKAAPLCVIGLSSQLDVIERLEKRVRSRFSHRQLYMKCPSSLESYLTIGDRILLENLNLKSELLSSKSIKKVLSPIYDVRSDIGYLKRILLTARKFWPDLPLDKSIAKSISLLSLDYEEALLGNLTLLETALLIAAKHMTTIYEGRSFNFEMVYHEFAKFVQRRNISLLKLEKPIVFKAFESLISRELFTSNERFSGSQKEYRLYSLQARPETIVSIVQAQKSIPLDIKEWAASELH